MSTANTLPSPALPVVGPDGRMNQVWFQFFLTLFRRTGDTQGASIDDWTVAAFDGAPPPDLAPLYGLVHTVEAMAAQAMAPTAQRPDERGETGDGGHFLQVLARLAEMEARAEAGTAPVAGPFDGANTGTTAPAAGGAGALPATPAGYVTVSINGTNRQIPYY